MVIATEKRDFAVEVIAKGEFIDDLGTHGKWRIETATVRLNGELQNAWYNFVRPETIAEERNLTPEEISRQWDELENIADERTKQRREQLEDTIAALSGLKGANNVKQVVSEIFAVVRMTLLD